MAIKVLALLYPKPEKVQRVEEIAQSVAEHVKEHEPGALQYQWFRVLGAEKPTIAVWEIWADQAAIEIHKSSSKVAWLEEISKKEDLFDQPLQILTLEQFAGFENR